MPHDARHLELGACVCMCFKCFDPTQPGSKCICPDCDCRMLERMTSDVPRR